MNRQEIVCDYIQMHYVDEGRLRHDVISNKVQIAFDNRCAKVHTAPLNGRATDVSALPTGRTALAPVGDPIYGWRDITTADVNDIVCDCSKESGLSIAAKEVLAVLQSHRIPDVHPLREYVLRCRPYEFGQPDVLSWLAQQVTVAGGEAEQELWRKCFIKWFVAMVASWLKDDIDQLEAHNDDFRAQENEEQLLAVYFDVPFEGEGKFMTTAEISDKLVIKGSIKKPMSLSRLGMMLQAAGYKSKRISHGKIRGWLVRELDADEVNANRNIEGKG